MGLFRPAPALTISRAELAALDARATALYALPSGAVATSVPEADAVGEAVRQVHWPIAMALSRREED